MCHVVAGGEAVFGDGHVGVEGEGQQAGGRLDLRGDLCPAVPAYQRSHCTHTHTKFMFIQSYCNKMIKKNHSCCYFEKLNIYCFFCMMLHSRKEEKSEKARTCDNSYKIKKRKSSTAKTGFQWSCCFGKCCLMTHSMPLLHLPFLHSFLSPLTPLSIPPSAMCVSARTQQEREWNPLL